LSPTISSDLLLPQYEKRARICKDINLIELASINRL